MGREEGKMFQKHVCNFAEGTSRATELKFQLSKGEFGRGQQFSLLSLKSGFKGHLTRPDYLFRTL